VSVLLLAYGFRVLVADGDEFGAVRAARADGAQHVVFLCRQVAEDPGRRAGNS